MQEYETTFILQPELTEEDVEALAKSFEQVLADQKATLVKSERWGKKRLAYRVGRHWDGYYIFFDYLGPNAAMVELERRLRIHEHAIKWLSVKKDPRAAAEEERKAARLAKMQRAGASAPEPQEPGGEEQANEG